MRIVETCNFGKDESIEYFLNIPPIYEREHAVAIAAAINNAFSSMHPRFWKVVENDYVLSKGFEP